MATYYLSIGCLSSVLAPNSRTTISISQVSATISPTLAISQAIVPSGSPNAINVAIKRFATPRRRMLAAMAMRML